MDGALTTQPSTRAVLPARNPSASSMQSPPASAEATSVMIWSPVLAPPGARPRSRCRSTSWGRPRCSAKVDGRISPALLTRRWSSKAIWIRSGSLRGSIYLVLLLLGRFGVSQTIIPEATGHFLIPSAHRHNHLFGGLGLRVYRGAIFALTNVYRAAPKRLCRRQPTGTFTPPNLLTQRSAFLNARSTGLFGCRFTYTMWGLTGTVGCWISTLRFSNDPILILSIHIV